MFDSPTLERLRKRAWRAILPSAIVFGGATAGYIYLALKVPDIADLILNILFPLSFLILATASCGWLFLASLIGLRRGEVTLEDEFGEATTYRGKGAAAWAIAGMTLAAVLYLLCLAVPVGILLEWLGVAS